MNAVSARSSYAEDPQWQRKFSIVWASLAGIAILASTPHLLNSVRTGRAFKGFFGISETFAWKHYSSMVSQEIIPARGSRSSLGVLKVVGSARLWSLPGLELNIGQSTSEALEESFDMLIIFGPQLSLLWHTWL